MGSGKPSAQKWAKLQNPEEGVARNSLSPEPPALECRHLGLWQGLCLRGKSWEGTRVIRGQAPAAPGLKMPSLSSEGGDPLP